MTDAERLVEFRQTVQSDWAQGSVGVFLLAQLDAVLAERDEARAEVAALRVVIADQAAGLAAAEEELAALRERVQRTIAVRDRELAAVDEQLRIVTLERDALRAQLAAEQAVADAAVVAAQQARAEAELHRGTNIDAVVTWAQWRYPEWRRDDQR